MMRSKWAFVFFAILLLVALPAAAQIQVNPTKLDFGDVSVKSSVTLFIEVSRPANASPAEELTIEVRAPSAPFSLERRGGALKLAPGGSLTLRLQLKPKQASQPGKVIGTLRLKTNDHKKPTTNVALAVELIAPQIKVTPTKLNLGKIPLGRETISSFEIKNEGNKQGSIKLRSLCKEIRVNPPSFTLKAGKVRIVQVRVKPTQLGKLQCEVVIESDDPKNPRITVTVSAEATDTSARPFSDLSPEAEGSELEIFNLSGHKVFASRAMTPFAPLHAFTLARNKLPANGVYLYVVMVRGSDGSVIKSAVRKLAVRR